MCRDARKIEGSFDGCRGTRGERRSDGRVVPSLLALDQRVLRQAESLYRDLPSLAVLFLEELVGVGVVRGFHVRPVPEEDLPGSQGDVAEEDDLGEAGGVLEVAAGGLAALA